MQEEPATAVQRNMDHFPERREMERPPRRSEERSNPMNTNKLSVYLQHISGQADLLHPFYLDHPYAKPNNWKADNAYAKPLKTLFITKKSHTIPANEHCQVHIVTPDGKPKPAYDEAKAKANMLETEKVLMSILSVEHDDPDWESRLNRTTWNHMQTKLFDRAMRILNHDRLARLTQQGSWNEPVLRRVTVDKSARRFRSLLSTFGWKVPLLQWLHNTFLEYLDIPYLASYIEILQTLKKKIPALTERLLSSVSYNSRIPPDAMTRMLKKPTDPAAFGLSCYNPTRLPGNPLILIVPSSPGSNTLQNARVQRWFQSLSMIGHVTVVSTNNLQSTKATMTTALDHMLAATRSKLAELRADHVGRTIILIGFNSGAALACQVALLEQITAVICMGFPLSTVEDKRGQPDDAILNLTVPVLFVTGQHGTTANIDDLEDLRERLRVETGLVVVGSADDQLRVKKSKLVQEGVTQCMVDRCIVDEIADFVGTILLTPPGQPAAPAPPTSPIVFRSENRARMKFVEKKRKNSGSEDTGASPRKTQLTPIAPKRVGRPPNRGGGRPKWTASNDVPIPRRSSEGVGGLSSRQPIDPIVSFDLTNDESVTLTGEDNLIDKLTPDSLMDMPVIIAPDEAPAEPSPVKMIINPPARRGVGRPPGKKKGAMKIIMGKDGLQVKKTIKTMGTKDDPNRPRIKNFPATQNANSPDL